MSIIITIIAVVIIYHVLMKTVVPFFLHVSAAIKLLNGYDRQQQELRKVFENIANTPLPTLSPDRKEPPITVGNGLGSGENVIDDITAQRTLSEVECVEAIDSKDKNTEIISAILAEIETKAKKNED